MNGLNRSIEYISNLVNNTDETKQEIINVYNSTDLINKGKVQMQEKLDNYIDKQSEYIYLNMSEVEPIIFRKNK